MVSKDLEDRKRKPPGSQNGDTTDTESTSEIETRVLHEDTEDFGDYKFGKFAATYFQGNATGEFLKRPLRYPLLQHENTGDQIVNKINYRLIIKSLFELINRLH